MNYDPRTLGLPHDTFRPSQLDAYKKALSVIEKGGGNLVIEAPTGVGKSGIATAIGANENILVLVHNHGLLDQYESLYNFKIIKGKQEYLCALKSKVNHWKEVYGIVPTAGDCHYHNMYECASSGACPYLIARAEAMSAKRMACTYKYASLSEQVANRGGVLCMDEAHDAYEELIEFAKFTIDEPTVKSFKFNKMPLVNFGQGGNGDILTGSNRSTVIEWVSNSIGKISKVDLFMEMTQENARNKKMFERLSMALEMLISGQDLFYKCNAPDTEDWRNDIWKKPGLVMEIRSLDVKNIVAKMVVNKPTVLMMSATIGNPKPLMGALGIDNYIFATYPHPTPKDKRPIYDLGFERMTKANLDSSPALYKLQADKIAQFILSLDPSWRSIVLTASNYKINLMRTFLRQKLGDRVIIPKTGTKLGEQLSYFIGSKDPGAIAVGTIQGWGSGISLDGDLARVSVVAGVAFSNPSDRFDALRMSSVKGKEYAFWNAYQGVVQATGRVSRGEIDEYGDFELNVACLADGSTTTSMAKSNYSKWFSEAIVRWK